MSFEIQKYLQIQSGNGFAEQRTLITTFCYGYYKEISSCLIEVEGSPVRGRVLVFGSADFSQIHGRDWRVVIETKNNKFKTLKWIGTNSKGFGIAEKIVRFAFSVLDLQTQSK